MDAWMQTWTVDDFAYNYGPEGEFGLGRGSWGTSVFPLELTCDAGDWTRDRTRDPNLSWYDYTSGHQYGPGGIFGLGRDQRGYSIAPKLDFENLWFSLAIKKRALILDGTFENTEILRDIGVPSKYHSMAKNVPESYQFAVDIRTVNKLKRAFRICPDHFTTQTLISRLGNAGLARFKGFIQICIVDRYPETFDRSVSELSCEDLREIEDLNAKCDLPVKTIKKSKGRAAPWWKKFDDENPPNLGLSQQRENPASDEDYAILTRRIQDLPTEIFLLTRDALFGKIFGPRRVDARFDRLNIDKLICLDRSLYSKYRQIFWSENLWVLGPGSDHTEIFHWSDCDPCFKRVEVYLGLRDHHHLFNFDPVFPRNSPDKSIAPGKACLDEIEDYGDWCNDKERTLEQLWFWKWNHIHDQNLDDLILDVREACGVDGEYLGVTVSHDLRPLPPSSKAKLTVLAPTVVLGETIHRTLTRLRGW